MNAARLIVILGALVWCSPGVLAERKDVVTSVEELDRLIQPVFLSSTDGRYLQIERVQAEYCSRIDSLPCGSSTGRCAMLVVQKLAERKDLTDPAERQKFTLDLLDNCAFHGTRFEATGSFQLLSGALARVHATAKSMSASVDRDPIIGTLPLRELNASANYTAFPVIYLNQRFTSLVADMAMLVCLSLPTYYDHAGININDNEVASRRLIEQSPTIRDAMLYYLGVYAGDSPDREYNSTPFCDDIQLNYAMSVLSFVIAHEYAHLTLRHPPSVRTALANLPSVASSSGSATKQISPFVREMEADALALRLLAHSPERFSVKSPKGTHKTYLGAIEFYFQVRDIFFEAAGLQEAGSDNGIAGITLQSATRVAACIHQLNCKVAEFEEELSRVFDMNTHPPARWRRAVAAEFRRLIFRDSPSPLEPIIDMMARNSWLLWSATRAEWNARATDKAKFAGLVGESKSGSGGEAELIFRSLMRSRENLLGLIQQYPDRLALRAEMNALTGRVGQWHLDQKDTSAARREFELALEGARALISASDVVSQGQMSRQGQRQVVAALNALAKLAQTGGDLALATRRYSEAIPIAERLLNNQTDAADLRESLAENLIQFSHLSAVLGHLVDAEQALGKVGKTLDQATQSSEQIDEMQSVRSELLWKLADAYTASKSNETTAQNHYKLAVSILERLASAITNEKKFQRLLAQRSTMLALRSPALESWQSVLGKWVELERRGGLQETDRKFVQLAHEKLAAEARSR